MPPEGISYVSSVNVSVIPVRHKRIIYTGTGNSLKE
jgi:hypothetical protein